VQNDVKNDIETGARLEIKDTHGDIVQAMDDPNVV
jgi:hypothetical protein